MKRFSREDSFAEWDKFWNSMEKEWFKVEILQDYSGEDSGSSLAAWKSGNKAKSIQLMQQETSQEWVNDCRKLKAREVEFIRIHIVERPLSQYLQWEIEHYKNINIPQCGEQVFILDKAAVKGLGLPAGDFMLFDQKRAVINQYNDSGLMVGAVFYDEGDDITELLALRTELMKKAIPLNAWLKSR